MSKKNGSSSLAGIIVGVSAGIALATAGVLVTRKVVNEIKNDSHETTMVSPNEKNFVTVTCGSSAFARGLTLVKVKAENETDHCELSFLIGQNAKISFNWKDDDNFELGIGGTKRSKVCKVTFEEKNINIKLSAKKA